MWCLNARLLRRVQRCWLIPPTLTPTLAAAAPRIAAAVAVVSAVALALVAAFVLRARVQGRTLLGSVIAPLTGASTTLLITDIQVSQAATRWESLYAEMYSLDMHPSPMPWTG